VRAADRPLLALSIGCPSGVGPEVAVAAAAACRDASCLLIGDGRVIGRAAALRGLAPRRVVEVADVAAARALAAGKVAFWSGSTAMRGDAPPGRPTREAGRAQLAWIDEGTELVRSGAADALVTGPVSKEAIARSGAPGARGFRGHTEHLMARLGAREVVMAFHGGGLTTALATTHLALARVPAAVTPEAVARATFWLADLLRRLGTKRPRLVVAAMNPHAGEGGLLGDEEQRRIVPGMRLAKKRMDRAGIAAELLGPIGAETAMRLGASGKVDAVVAMYHDQATIACKLVGFGEAVNVTLGLPIIRTSVDHGTGYDVAGTGQADDAGMRAALALATVLAQEARRAGGAGARRAIVRRDAAARAAAAGERRAR
jgi:4-hydroxythreonine-4-phosphate dehydrogenase